MGAGASAFRKKGAVEKRAAENKTEAAAKKKTAVEATAENQADGKVEKVEDAPDNEESDTSERVYDILCRLAQAHPTQTPKRWDLITQKLNRTMKKKKIPAQPLKAMFDEEGLCIPQCWVAEKAEKAKNKLHALEAKNKTAEKEKGVFGRTLYGKKQAAAGVGQDGKGGDDADVAGESDTELESDVEGEEIAGDTAVGEGDEPAYVYQALSKYEVFSCMRRVHDQVGAGKVKTEEVVEEMERAEKMVKVLYEHLPAETLKAISQQNRIKAGLGQDSLVYGEILIPHFLKVMVKLKLIHGHMMSPGGSFWDLGSGVGKLVIAAAMMHNFEDAHRDGQPRPYRHTDTLPRAATFATKPVIVWSGDTRGLAQRIEAAARQVPKLKAAKAGIRLHFIFADVIKQQGWVAEATLLFVHTNFTPSTLRELRIKAGDMKIGAICLSVSLAAVDEDKWGLLAVEHVETSWGGTKLYIHEKLAE